MIYDDTMNRGDRGNRILNGDLGAGNDIYLQARTIWSLHMVSPGLQIPNRCNATFIAPDLPMA
ncbi:MAG: hypothetical protein ABL997_15975 [Planctomycetota bacterium]